MTETRLRIALQKSGRLHNDSMDLLERCGIRVITNTNTLFCHCKNLPIDLLFVRVGDIPNLVADGLCDVGIIGENVFAETAADTQEKIKVVQNLGFSRCQLKIAIPSNQAFDSIQDLTGKRIATSYPVLLEKYLTDNQVSADITKLSGSVEIAPRLGLADAICDIVSTGQTLEANNLKAVADVFSSEATLIRCNTLKDEEKSHILALLLSRMNGVLQAKESKYILFHAPKDKLRTIQKLLPGNESATLMPLEDMPDKMAVHVVSSEGIFWETLEKLKKAGASSILVLPIEKMLS